MKKFLLLLGVVWCLQADKASDDDIVVPRVVITNFFDIVLSAMNLAASKGDQKAQLSAGTKIAQSLCNIFLLATKRLPNKELMTTEEFRDNMVEALQEMNIPELLAEECQQKRHIFISLLEESEQIVQPS